MLLLWYKNGCTPQEHVVHADLNVISKWLDDLLSATFYIYNQTGYQNNDSADKLRGRLSPGFLLSRDW